jgi:hypothetical protein
MPATPTDIAGASREVAVAAWESATMAARYPSARDASVTPSPGFFDQLNDAQSVINARGLIIGVERRRFAVVAADVVWPAISTAIPQISLIDPEQSVTDRFLAARIELNLDAETTTYELFG